MLIPLGKTAVKKGEIMKKHFITLLILMISILGVSQVFAQVKQEELLLDILPGKWHGRINLSSTGRVHPEFGQVYSGWMCVMQIISLTIEPTLDFTGWAKIVLQPTRWLDMSDREMGTIQRIDWHYTPSEVVTKINGKIEKNGVLNINYDPTIKIKVTEISEMGQVGIVPITKEVKIEELTIIETLERGWMYLSEIDLKSWEKHETEDGFLLEKNYHSGELPYSPIISSTSELGVLAGWPLCTKKDKIPLDMLLSTEYKDEIKTYSNGTKVRKTKDNLRIVTKDGCVELYMKDYFRITGADGTEMEMSISKVLDGVISSELYQGSIQVDIWEGSKYHHFFTRNAIVEVSGTNFIMEVSEDGTTILTVLDGEVEFSDVKKKKTILVKKNQKSIVKPGGLPTEPKAIEQNQIPRWWE